MNRHLRYSKIRLKAENSVLGLFGKEAMSVEDLATKYDFSSYFRRWVAAFLDNIFFFSLLVVPTFFLSKDLFFQNPWVLLPALLIGYYVLPEGLTGFTLGKFIARVRVVNMDGNKPGLLKSALRTFLRLIEVNPVLFGNILAGILVLASEKHQRLGDMIAKTFVLKVKDLKEFNLNKGVSSKLI